MPGRSFQPSSGSGWCQIGALKPTTRSAISASTSAKSALARTRTAGSANRFTPRSPGPSSVELELVLVVLLERRVLRFLAQEAVADRQRLDLGAHEAAERVLGRTDDRLAAHVEARVDDHRASGLLLEAGDEVVVARVGLLVHGLHARRIVDVRDRRDRGARHVQLLDAEELLLLLGHCDAVLPGYVGDKQHVRALGVELEPLRRIIGKHRRREGTERLAVLDFQVERLLHRRRARVAEDRARAERARAELHAALEPAERPALGERLGALLDQLLIAVHLEHRAGAAQPLLDIGLRELRPEIAAAHGVETDT